MYNAFSLERKKFDDCLLFIIYSKECLFFILQLIIKFIKQKKLQMTIVCFTHCLEI